jgi:hypothetical protein
LPIVVDKHASHVFLASTITGAPFQRSGHVDSDTGPCREHDQNLFGQEYTLWSAGHLLSTRFYMTQISTSNIFYLVLIVGIII